MPQSPDIFDEVPRFLETIFSHLSEDGIDVSRYYLDHICYRVETLAEYYELQNFLGTRGSLLIESIVGGRPISTYRLHVPIMSYDRAIYLIELPSPKEGSPYRRGWEHAEFAIGDDWRTFLDRYSQITFDLRGYNKLINPEISRKYDDGLSVKFHEYPLDEIIERYER